jgi:histidinol-phosphate phosphatase family protein
MNTDIQEQLAGYNTLFLDRDGTINKRLFNDYVKSIDDFEFLPGVMEAFYIADQIFEYVIVVTNQQGVGKELMLLEELVEIHDNMVKKIEQNLGRIDQIYSCTDLAIFDPLCRKPNPGMALQAQKEFPNIDFKRSIMVGDTHSDMEFGRRLGMYTVLINDKTNQHIKADLRVDSLLTFLKNLV